MSKQYQSDFSNHLSSDKILGMQMIHLLPTFFFKELQPDDMFFFLYYKKKEGSSVGLPWA